MTKKTLFGLGILSLVGISIGVFYGIFAELLFCGLCFGCLALLKYLTMQVKRLYAKINDRWFEVCLSDLSRRELVISSLFQQIQKAYKE